MSSILSALNIRMTVMYCWSRFAFVSRISLKFPVSSILPRSVRNLRRAKARKMDSFCRKLKAQPSFRKALRPGVPEHSTYMVPLDQISPQHDIVLSQEPKQREVLNNSTRLSIDNNHKCALWWAERTISMRALLHNRQWMWVGDFLCLRKDEELHARAAKMLFDKCCTCEGTGRGCALNGIKAIFSDFETGLWKPFLQELHKHQSDWDLLINS